MGRSDDLSSYLFRFPHPVEQLLLALAVHEPVSARISAQDLYCWLLGSRRHRNLDWRWASEHALLEGLKALRRDGLVAVRDKTAAHETSVTWALTRRGWDTLGGRCLFEPADRAA
jgi:hypothetical protein